MNVPDIQVNITEEQEQLIRTQVNLLGESDCYGINLYIHVRDILLSFDLH